MSDAQRAAAGRETVAARMRTLLPGNRRRAAAAYAAGGLPDGAEVLRVWDPRDPAELRGRLGDGHFAVWAEDDVLQVLWRGEAEQVVLGGGVHAAMWPVDGDGGLWEASLRVRRLDEAVIMIAVLAMGAEDLPFGRPMTDMMTWRGPRAPLVPADDAPLAGEVSEHVVDSAALRGPRPVSVYVPPGGAGGGPLPGCVLADGQSVAAFARVLEPAIVSGAAPPVVLVGVHSAADPGKKADPRGQEYLPGWNPRRFAAHMSFVTEEVIPWAGSSFPVTAGPWVCAGFSNGAAWAIGAAQRLAGRVRRGGGVQRGDRAQADRPGVTRGAALPRGRGARRGIPAVHGRMGAAAAAGRGPVQPSRMGGRARPVLVVPVAAGGARLAAGAIAAARPG